MKLADVETVAVIGAGTMGHGIAELASLAEYDVHLQDVSDEHVRDGCERIEWRLERLEDSGTLDDGEAGAVADRITTFTDLDDATPERGIIVSNTLAFSISELSEATGRPERVCGMHFFNPPNDMQLVEVTPGAHSAEETLDLVEGLAADFGKTPVRIRKDSLGFVVNRVLISMLNEAAWLVETDVVTVAEVDSTAKYDLGLSVGCFELLDHIGIDIAVDVMEYMQETFGAAYEPCPLLVEYVKAGTYGKKSGEGFYDYEDGGADVPTNEGSEGTAAPLVAVAVNEAGKLVDADVSTPDVVDGAVMLGAGFPEGPAALAVDHGFDHVHETLARLVEETDEPRSDPSPRPDQWATEGGTKSATVQPDGGADFETIKLVYPEDGVAHVVLNRPDRLNSVNGTLLSELDLAMDQIEADDDARVLLITGAGDAAFCGGADLKFMGDGLEPFEAVAFSRRGQQVFGRIAELPIPVVAGVGGFALGGGMELATCVDLCVAGESAKFGQPELNLGILPAWGGTQRLRHVVGERRAREILLTAERYDAETMYEYGFVNEVVDDGTLDDRALELATSLAQGPPLAQEATKNAMLAGQNDVGAGLRAESDAFGLLWTTEDTIEGIAAFHDRRPPEFEGK